MVADPVWPGLSASDVAEKAVGQPEGWLELMLNVLSEHPAESLFLTDTV
jgi:hypothetical protein